MNKSIAELEGERIYLKNQILEKFEYDCEDKTRFDIEEIEQYQQLKELSPETAEVVKEAIDDVIDKINVLHDIYD